MIEKSVKKFGVALGLNGVTNFSNTINYVYVNPLINVVYKNKKNIFSSGILIPVMPVNNYKYWFSFNYLRTKYWTGNKTILYGANVDFSRFSYRYHSISNFVSVNSYYKKFSSEALIQIGFLYKLHKNTSIMVNLGLGVNIAFNNDPPSPRNKLCYYF